MIVFILCALIRSPSVAELKSPMSSSPIPDEAGRMTLQGWQMFEESVQLFNMMLQLIRSKYKVQEGMIQQAKSRFGSPKLTRRQMSPVQFMNSPLFKSKKDFTFTNMTYISKKTLKRATSFNTDSTLPDLQYTKETLTSRPCPQQNPQNPSHFRIISQQILEPQSTENTLSKLTQQQLFLDMESLSLHSLNDEQSRVKECEKKIEEQQKSLDEQCRLIGMQGRQLEEMKIRNKKMRDELERTKIGLAMSNRKRQEQSKLICKLQKQLEEYKNMNNCSLQFSIESSYDLT